MDTLIAGRRIRYAAIGLVGIAALLLIALAGMPWGLFKSAIEARLSKQLDRAVTIGSLERVDHFSLSPTIALKDVRVPQAAWAGAGYLARVREARVTLPVFPLLLGHVRPTAVAVSGLRLWLVRDANHRTNWSKEAPTRGGSGSLPKLDELSITDTVLSYRDAVQDRNLTVRLVSNQSDGLRLMGRGTVRGAAVTLGASAPGVDSAQANRPWPFKAWIDGEALSMRVTGAMDRPLDTAHMTMDVAARAADLKLIDAVIEAGLFGTQPVQIATHVRRDGAVWKIDRIKGLVGRSDVAGTLTVTKGQRTRLVGSVASNNASFDDFASDAGLAAAVALERAQGLKIVPNTRINIRKIDDTDGTIKFIVRHLSGGRRPSSLTSLSGAVTIDHQLMTVPLTIGLQRGEITGTATVDQRGGRAVPIVTLDLTMRGSSIGALAGGDDVNARVDGRVRLQGPGSTIREAVGNSNGTIGLVARDGVLPAKIAALIGFDVARGLTTARDQQARLNCAVARFVVDNGAGRADPLIVDTSLSQSRATGTLRFPTEALGLTVTGAPKQKSALRLPGSVAVGGTLRSPTIFVPKETKSVGNILRAIGRSITGDQRPRATDADCDSLTARALR